MATHNDTRFCTACGKDVWPGVMFCRFCGQAVTPRAVAARELAPPVPSITPAGNLNPELLCPHCQSKGNVRLKTVGKKPGKLGTIIWAVILIGIALSAGPIGWLLGIIIIPCVLAAMSMDHRYVQALCEKCNMSGRLGLRKK